jgi:queuine/archaeosine tRNA-ribosyltransferase
MLKSGGKIQGNLGVAIGLTFDEMTALRGERSMTIDLSDLGPEWAGRTLMIFAAANDATLAATLRGSAPDATITDQRRRIIRP